MEVSTNPDRRTARILGAVAVLPAIVGVVAGWFAGGPLGAVVGLIVLGAGAPGLLWLRAGRADAAGIGGDIADRQVHARFYNLAEGLCTVAGVKLPELRVLDSDGLNVATEGRDTGQATVVATTGLLAALTRMELEGVVAAALAEIRRGDTRPATIAAAAGGIGARVALEADRDRLVDEAAALLTRYPPGLISAYRKFAATGTAVAGANRRTAYLWLADPAPSGAPAVSYRTSLAERIEALEVL
jgi:heat shock protein HtpX